MTRSPLFMAKNAKGVEEAATDKLKRVDVDARELNIFETLRRSVQLLVVQREKIGAGGR